MHMHISSNSLSLIYIFLEKLEGAIASPASMEVLYSSLPSLYIHLCLQQGPGISLPLYLFISSSGSRDIPPLYKGAYLPSI